MRMERGYERRESESIRVEMVHIRLASMSTTFEQNPKILWIRSTGPHRPTCRHASWRAPLPWRKVSACRMAFALFHLLRGLSSSRESLISASGVVCGEARQLPRETRDPELLGGLEVLLLRGGL